MGLLGDIKSTITLDYKANVDQAKAALRDLEGAQKKQGQAAVTALEDQVKAHENLAAKIAVTAGVVGGAIAVGISAFKAYERQTRLTAASSGADMDALRSASHGLMTDLELMSVAAEGMNGRFKLTSAEMGNVLEAAVALERRGMGPLSAIVQKLGDAVKKGEIDPLKDLGVVYDEVLAKTDKRAAAMKAIIALQAEAANGTETEIERLRAGATEAENYWNRAKAGVGQFAMESVAGLVMVNDKLLEAKGRIVDVFSYGGSTATISDIFKLAMASNVANAALTDLAAVDARVSRQLASAIAESDRQRAQAEGNVDYLRGARMDEQRAAIEKQKADSAARAAANRRAAGGRGRAKPQANPFANDVIMHGPLFSETMGAAAAPDYLAESFASSTGGQGFAPIEQGPTWMERTFGPAEQFDIYKSAFSGFTDAATAGYTALVTGSESAGKAMKRIVAQSIMAEGQHMLIRALREAAEAISALASGNLPSAAAHGLAAAKFGAGAALAGIVANQLGAGSSSTAGASSASAATAGGVRNTGGGDMAPRNTTVVLGHGWDDETPRQRAARLARANRQAASYEAPPQGVSYS
mgnify:CR=1 FL=1